MTLTVRLNRELEDELKQVTGELDLNNADIVRMGLRRIFEEYQRTGKVELRSRQEPEAPRLMAIK